MQPTVQATVIIVNWKRYDLTAQCLRAVRAQSVSFMLDVIVVDNESDPAQLSLLLTEYPEVRAVPQSANLGFAEGVAVGVGASTAPVIVLINNDAEPEPGFLQAGLERLLSSDDIGAVAATLVLDGRYTAAADPAAEDALVDPAGRSWIPSDARDAIVLVNSTGVSVDRRANGRDRDWLVPIEDLGDSGDPFGFSGGGAFLRRAALEQVGGFDSSLFMYYEDLDVSWRMRLAGWRIVWARDAVARHRFAASSGRGSSLVRVQSMRNRLLVVQRNGSRALLAAVVLSMVARRLKDLVRPSQARLSSAEWRRVLVRRSSRPASISARTSRRALEGAWFGLS